MDKYISFEPWWSGHSNLMMSFSLACAISEITGRILILPPKWHILFFTGNEKENFQDWWGVMNKSEFLKNFNCVEYYDIPEYVKLETDDSYFSGVENIARVYNRKPVDSKLVYVNDLEFTPDFEEFNSDNRKIVDLNVSDKFIHFDNNLFGHFYYHVYANSPEFRKSIKTKIKRGLVYKTQLLHKSWKVGDSIGPYNAIHVRRGDFEHVRKRTMQDGDEILDSIKSKISNNLPLYIATDKKDRSFFLPLRRHYNVFFFDDFSINCEGMELLCIEQLICSQSEKFLGSFLSTFTDYINIFRGYRGDKEVNYREGVNYDRGELVYQKYPWETEQYSWDKIWDYQWKEI